MALPSPKPMIDATTQPPRGETGRRSTSHWAIPTADPITSPSTKKVDRNDCSALHSAKPTSQPRTLAVTQRTPRFRSHPLIARPG